MPTFLYAGACCFAPPSSVKRLAGTTSILAHRQGSSDKPTLVVNLCSPRYPENVRMPHRWLANRYKQHVSLFSSRLLGRYGLRVRVLSRVSLSCCSPECRVTRNLNDRLLLLCVCSGQSQQQWQQQFGAALTTLATLTCLWTRETLPAGRP